MNTPPRYATGPSRAKSVLKAGVESRVVVHITFHLSHCISTAYILTYSLVLSPSDHLGLLNYGCLFFPIDCLLSPSLNTVYLETGKSSGGYLTNRTGDGTTKRVISVVRLMICPRRRSCALMQGIIKFWR